MVYSHEPRNGVNGWTTIMVKHPAAFTYTTLSPSTFAARRSATSPPQPAQRDVPGRMYSSLGSCLIFLNVSRGQAMHHQLSDLLIDD